MGNKRAVCLFGPRFDSRPQQWEVKKDWLDDDSEEADLLIA